MTATRTLVHCTHCGRTRRSGGHGLCKSCYDTARRIRGRRGTTPRPRRRLTLDPVAVTRAAAGETPAPLLNPAELRAAVQRMQTAGESIRATALRLGTSERHVSRLRAAQHAANVQESVTRRPARDVAA